jgi:hypothetical protein
MRSGSVYEVDVEIRNGVKDGREVVHSSARAILTNGFPTPPPFKENGHFKVNPPKHSLEELYAQILFHGDDLRGIRDIIRISEEGMTARLSAAPTPLSWMQEPLRSRWIGDPLVLDCAFQMGIVWCHENHNKVSLPSFAASYRQYRDRFPDTGVIAVLEIDSVTDHKMVGNFTFLDEEKKVVAHLNGYEAIMDENLIGKFRPN